MARRFAGDKLIVATHNAGKLVEFRDLLGATRLTVVSAAELGLPEPEETGATFAENAELKARAAADAAGEPALGDDSGISVAGLGGAPGIHSARWAETESGERDFAAAMALVESKLAGRPSAAYFVSVLALAWPGGHCEIFEGRVHGAIVFPGRGDYGFGYDPIFQPEGYDMTFGEMTFSEKQRMSHRTVAFEKLVAACFAGESGT